jgi:hypothetical protein
LKATKDDRELRVARFELQDNLTANVIRRERHRGPRGNGCGSELAGISDQGRAALEKSD